MKRHDHRQIANKANHYRQSCRARQMASEVSQKSPPPAYKRLLLPALLALFIAALAIGIVAILHTSLNVSASANTTGVAQSGNGDTALNVSPPTGTPATPQVRTGVFAPGAGGPIPVPANVLKPTNSARTVLNGEIYSIYAGAMTRQPAVGVLAVLQENALSGQQSLHLYQSPQQLGSLTILSLQQNIVTFSAPGGSQGHFNLLTDQFQFS